VTTTRQHEQLADIGYAVGVLVGNLDYYFKTKDDIIAAVVQAHREQLESTLADSTAGIAAPEPGSRRSSICCPSRADATARYGCPYGTLSSELAKQPLPPRRCAPSQCAAARR